jgi:transmembrane sensor
MAQMSGAFRIQHAPEDRFEAAARWFTRWRRARTATLEAREVDEWTAWIRDPDNQAAFDAVQSVARVRRLLKQPAKPSAAELAADDFDGSTSVVEWNATRRPKLTGTPLRRRLALAGIAAVLMLGLLAVTRWLGGYTSAESTLQVETAAGEKKQVTLPDGSSVWLGAETQLSVRYDRCLRTVFLNAGEALFSVAHDSRCPFRVIAGNGAITAIGTQFSVRRTLDRVTVVVAEGVVKVQPRAAEFPSWTKDPEPSGAVWKQARLSQGQEVSYDGTAERSPVETEDPSVATAWLEGRREYRNEPLSYVIADVNRSFSKHIVLSDSAVGNLRFTGRVYQNELPDWLQALPIIFPVAVLQNDPEHTVIRPR